MDTAVEVRPEHETVFAYRYRRHTEAKIIQSLGTRERWSQLLSQAISTYAGVIHPLSKFKRNWERFIASLVVFNSMIIPWQIAFRLDKECSQALEAEGDTCISDTERRIAIVMDAVFWLDMILSFCSGYVDRHMMIHMTPAEIVKRYIRLFFWLDLVANFPYYTIASRVAESGSFEGHIATNLYILPKLLRAARLFRDSGGSRFSPSLSRIAKMVSSFVMASHWCGCIWYFIGRWEVESVGANRFTGGVAWIEVPLGEEGATYLTSDLRTKYTASIYWAVTTMSTVGYGDISPQTNIERIYTMVVMFLGATSTALILGNVAVLIASFNSASQELRDKRYHLDEYLRARQIPHGLCKRARTSLHYSWTVKRGVDYEKILEEIPQNMKTDILLYIHTAQIQGAYLFVQCDKLLIRSLVSKLKPESYAPGETIIYEGDIAEHMYYIKTGKVKVMCKSSNRVLDVMSDGDLFGETEFFDVNHRSATIQALTAVDVQMLTRESFFKLLEDFPEYYNSFKDMCTQRRNAFEKRRNARSREMEAAASEMATPSRPATNRRCWGSGCEMPGLDTARGLGPPGDGHRLQQQSANKS